ncbi:bifunctional 5,10-methylenetetrahydrofolate dehydrogenase/5,10-methenyltetrahydrofolate cyclohydrolase [Oribacterium sp. WCC10]|uniref:bifunctional 5,10-methylenetetrahydrofolate dehydrogenase/5,10-methenyltetrahydrofolate cyclohydrolase n=1 Tax=Oribacterium sp. WCC10 TaxID=1855343 RepID=UPI0008EA7F24|nr:bifunctional 5,10-methylenetetrahydrofolate dehydrogenase/5,10-methenyltetrahydrofolate cyclohydrolase [Oribacterium sp. WCC10]SFG21375.1 methylenetetrahydrofolate dehydrogenase (NADP+) / methenyltetrahydrofolate cyclohydrolase [Oribacterium sp. WCC10]
MQELKGKLIADRIKGECLDFVGKYNGILPALAILRVGDKEADIAYERNIKKRFVDFGLEAKDYELPANCTNEEFQEVFDFINNDPDIHGILVMRPLPEHIDEEAMLKKMNPLKDLDGITDANVAGIMRGDKDAFAPCTAQAVVEILKGYNIEMAGKRACIIGRSMVVGKPLSMLLLKENATVTVCHSKTVNIKSVASEADIVVAAIGKAKQISGGYVKEDATVIDVGINVDEQGNLSGDCDWDQIVLKAGAATPVPGGVGTVTTAVLAKHLVDAARLQLNLPEVDDSKDEYIE